MRLTFRRSLQLLGLSVLAGVSSAASASVVLIPTSYAYITAPHPNYADTGGTEASDGLIAPGSFSGNGGDWSAYFGWQNTNGKMTFNFSGNVALDALTVWAADDDGYVGVGLPASFTIAMGGSTVTRNVTGTAGTGVRELAFSGLGLSGSSLTLTINSGSEWTMLTEVMFFGTNASTPPSTPPSTNGVPEPASLALVGLALAGLCAGRRRATLRRR